MDFEKLVNLAKLNASDEQQRTSKPSNFDYSIDVKVEDEATLTFVLSKEFNQSLVAVLSGNFKYESIAGKPNAQGELQLLEGSTLEFIKVLNAEGKVRFESEIDNPYLDIVAVYKNYYYPETSSSSSEGGQSNSTEVEVAVKMKIKGVLKELDKNLAQQSDKLAVYYGTKNIEDDIPDPTKDASDAVMFMLLDKFNDNVTQQERNVVSSYAASFAGSLVGGFLNRQFGDYVKNLEIRQTGTDTKFILAGRAGKFRYSIGGSTAVFQDLGLANVKIEYPITRSFFMRLERKEALSQTQYSEDMINELGLKYRFEF
jgi:ribosomal protein L13